MTYTGATTVDTGTLKLIDTTAFASAATVNATGILERNRTVAGFANRYIKRERAFPARVPVAVDLITRYNVSRFVDRGAHPNS